VTTGNDVAVGDGSDLVTAESAVIVDSFERGVGLLKAESYDAALQEFSKHLELNPGSQAAWFNSGFALDKLDRLEESLHAYLEATQLSPQDEAAWFNQGKVLGRLGRHREAVAAVSKAIALNPNDPVNWFEKGYELSDAGRHKEALEAYDEAIRLRPTDAVAWSNKGFEYNKLNRPSDALVAYSKALELDPDHIQAWLGKGRALSKLKRYSEALAVFARGAELEPEGAAFFSFQGDMLLKLKKPDDALLMYSRAFELEPDKAWVDDTSIRRAAQLSGNFRRLRVDSTLDDSENGTLEAWVRHHGRALIATDRFSDRRDNAQLIALSVFVLAAFGATELLVTWWLGIVPTFALMTAGAVIAALGVSVGLTVLWMWGVTKVDNRYSQLVLTSTVFATIVIAALGLWLLTDRQLPIAIRQIGATASVSTAELVSLTLLIVATDYLIEALFNKTQPHPEALHSIFDLVSTIKRQPEKWGDHAFMKSQVDLLERSARFVESIPRRFDTGDATTNKWFFDSTLGAACKLRALKRLVLAPGATSHEDLVGELVRCLPAVIVGNWYDIRSDEGLPQSTVRWWRRVLNSSGRIVFSFLPLASVLAYQALGPVKLAPSVVGTFAAAAVLWLILSFVVMDPLYEQKTKALPGWSGMVMGGKKGPGD
jgi:tetratricopeptide (TPR) repeat protein